MTQLLQLLHGLLVASTPLMIVLGLSPAAAAKDAAPHANTAKAPAAKPAAKPNARRPSPPTPASAPTDRGDAHWRHHGVG